MFTECSPEVVSDFVLRHDSVKDLLLINTGRLFENQQPCRCSVGCFDLDNNRMSRNPPVLNDDLTRFAKGQEFWQLIPCCLFESLEEGGVWVPPHLNPPSGLV